MSDTPQIPDQAGRTWLITGATNGIGRETARAAARAGARLILPARSRRRAEELARELAAVGAQVATPHLDLADLGSVRAAAAEIREPVDVLVNNAGAVTHRRRESPDGFELMLATNFLGPFALTNLLADQVRDRVVIVGSNMHRRARLDVLDPNFRHRRWSFPAAYGQSKLADLLWGRALQHRLRETGRAVDVQLAHPGWAYTNLQNATGVPALDRGLSALSRRMGQPAADGALPLLEAATAPLEPLTYLGPDGFQRMRGRPSPEQPSDLARDDAAARAAWALGVALTGTDLEGGA